MTDLIRTRLRFGPFQVDLTTRELLKSGVRVKLSGQPFEILTALLERPGQLVTREELRKRIWSEDTFVDFSHGLNAAVNKLREALCDSADDPRYVETLPRRGYRFIASIEQVSTSAPLSASSQGSVTPSAPAPTLTPATPVQEPIWRGSLANEDWQETLPVKRHALVQIASLVSGILLIAVGLTGVWSHWNSSPSFEEAEQHLKRAAGPFAYQAAERALKQLSEGREANNQGTAEPQGTDEVSPVRPAATAQATAQPQLPAAGHKANAHPDPSDDAVILRLARSGAVPRFFRERSSVEGPAILRLDFTQIDRPTALKPIVAGRDAIAGPQPSPDGSKLAFMAGRNNAMDIWVSNADGSSPRRLTNSGRTGTPRWSPDGRWIAFDSDGRFGRSGIFVVSADGGPVRAVVEDESNNSVPSWSRDGKHIYFASNRGLGWEADQVWKVLAEGGRPVQITQQGGFSGYESADGKTLYYAKSRYENPEIWQVPVNGGTESRVSLLHPTTWASWALTAKGILLLGEYRGQTSVLEYFDFATRSVHSLAILDKASFWLASSPNGSSIWYSELTDDQARQVFKAGLD